MYTYFLPSFRTELKVGVALSDHVVEGFNGLLDLIWLVAKEVSYSWDAVAELALYVKV